MASTLNGTILHNKKLRWGQILQRIVSFQRSPTIGRAMGGGGGILKRIHPLRGHLLGRAKGANPVANSFL